MAAMAAMAAKPVMAAKAATTESSEMVWRAATAMAAKAPMQERR